MDVIHIQHKPDEVLTPYWASAIEIKSPKATSARLIPHPYGQVSMGFETLEAAVAGIHKAGYEAEFEGQRFVHAKHQQLAATKPVGKLTGREHAIKESIPLLTQQLKDKTPQVVASALEALAAIADTETISAIMNCLTHDDAGVRKQAAFALAKMGKPAIPRLAIALEDSEWLFRHSALVAIIELIALYQKEPPLLDDLLKPLLPHVLSCLKHDHWLVRSQAAQVVAKLSAVGGVA